MQQFIDHLLEGLNLGEKLSDEEMSRMIRFVLAFEEEAFQLYMHLMTSTDNCKISAVRLLGNVDTAGKKLLH
jgi:hypothetical protein